MLVLFLYCAEERRCIAPAKQMENTNLIYETNILDISVPILFRVFCLHRSSLKY